MGLSFFEAGFCNFQTKKYCTAKTAEKKSCKRSHGEQKSSKCFLLSSWDQFHEGPENFSHPKSRSKISILMITELCYAYILNMNRGSLQTRRFRRIHLSVFKCRLTKNGFAGPKSFRGFRGPFLMLKNSCISNCPSKKILHNLKVRKKFHAPEKSSINPSSPLSPVKKILMRP